MRTGRQDFYGRILIGGKRPLRNFDGFAGREGFAQIIVSLFLHRTQQRLGCAVGGGYDDFRSIGSAECVPAPQALKGEASKCQGIPGRTAFPE